MARSKPRTDPGLPHSVRCPKCGSFPGDLCLAASSNPLPGWYAHQARVLKARSEHGTQLQAAIMAVPDLESAWPCCSWGFGTLDAMDAHRADGHSDPERLGMVPTARGWVF